MSIDAKRPVISVIVPVYNTEEYFDRCMQSILTQSYKNLEIIVVNDGSAGNIQERIKEYEQDERVHFADIPKNQGLLRARVHGAKASSGEYLAFVDSDDYISYDYLRSLIRRAEETDADITIGKTVWNDEGKCFVYNYHESCFHFDLLVGDEIRKEFFSQEAQCYSWHTIWNKLYRRSLWDICMPEFETVQSHIVMTEDIYFSAILFYHAQRITRTGNDAYFYCMNKNASTDSNKITIKKFEKNIRDITYVFNKVFAYLKDHNANAALLESFGKARAHYAGMWSNLAEAEFEGEELLKSRSLLGAMDAPEEDISVNDYFFESVQSPWNGGLEYIKEQIGKSGKAYISFDIFDTLITRPFYEPEDIFRLLDLEYEKLENNGLSFSRIRTEGEELAREYYGKKQGYADISLTEIYDYIEMHYNLGHSLLSALMDKEKELEIAFSQVRRSGRELFQLALEADKKVLLITDMYLDRATIEAVLKKNGITGYEELFISCEERKLKASGDLFRHVLRKKELRADELLHVGDSWNADIEGSKKAGITAFFFPKASEVFENKIHGCTTNNMADIQKRVIGNLADHDGASDNLGINCMRALIAQNYFDNPYRSFHPESDFNADPYLIGYYLLGMHLMGLSKWIAKEAAKTGRKRIVFLSRDGYLPKLIFDKYKEYVSPNMETRYIQASRKALLPVMLCDKSKLYQIPAEYRAHSPASLMEILRFAREDESDSWRARLKEEGTDPDPVFDSKEKFHLFIQWFLKNIYSSGKHRYSQNLAEKYYRQLKKDTDILFDMGYSGRIQEALCTCVGAPLDVLYLHEDYKMSVDARRRGGFKISSFYDFIPAVTGLIREYIFSDLCGSCIGFEEKEGEVHPAYENSAHLFPDRFVIQSLQRGACDFASDFLEKFGDVMDIADYSPVEVSFPFEGFLTHPSEIDIRIFSESFSEDQVYGARERINIRQFMISSLVKKGCLKLPVQKEEELPAGKETEYTQQPLIDILNGMSKRKRALFWMTVDKHRFFGKLQLNLKRILSAAGDERGKKNGF